MDTFAFWQQKIIQFFHDPPAKPFGGTPKTGKLNTIANRLFDLFQAHNQGRKWRYWYKSADWAAAGADRPLLYAPKQKGVSGLGTLTWSKYPLITHPLAPGWRLELRGDATGLPEKEAPDDLPDMRDLIAEQEAVARQLADGLRDWTDADSLHASFITLWRRYRDDLMAEHPHDPLWQELPADSRCPDHAIWDHLKVTTALAFMLPHTSKQAAADQDSPREPWMLRVELGPVGRFIAQARTSRDLWISSMLLADLAWHAMRPVVERYGPDCIVYPDLRANPRADVWLSQRHPDALPAGQDDPATFAAVLPDAFVALVPRGGAGDLPPLEELAAACQDGVAKRWQALHTCVRDWLTGELPAAGDGWRTIWERQTRTCPIHVTWAAVPWRPLEHIAEPASLRGPALPCQSPPRPDIPAADAQAIAARANRLCPWVPPVVWTHYEHARQVFAHTHLEMHQIERGFDYALTHHMLRTRHALRGAANPAPVPEDEPGEKCTLCGSREALHAGAADHHHAPLGVQRAASRAFWAHESLDPDRTGAERLCAVCATKRFLVRADQAARPEGSRFNLTWAGPRGLAAVRDSGSLRDRDGLLRVPFPSTATLATQAFLAEVLATPALAGAVDAVTRACRDAGLPRTSFPRALPQLAAARPHDLLLYEAEDVLFPEVPAGKARVLEARQKADEAKTLRTLAEAVATFRTAVAKKRPDLAPPGTRVAVLRLDGDRMGKLLAGDAEAIAARWRDILHPEVLKRLGDSRDWFAKAGWPGLLDQKRLMGPSLHAFISRALGHFSHRIVPWVVEREFSGRLIYAGGDDVLCLAPADQALNLAARLHQVFSAPWVVDTMPGERPWAWRTGMAEGAYDQQAARRRFLLPRQPEEAGAAIRLNQPDQPVARHVCDEAGPPATEAVRGHLLPMLGPGASLSAGIAIGHYKTPLSLLLERAKALEGMAKDQGGRRAVAIGHASRGGVKTGFTLPWGEAGDGSPTAHRTMGLVIEGFRAGGLSGSLPYKLRALTPALRAGLEVCAQDAAARARLVDGLFASCLGEGGGGSGRDDGAEKAALDLWRCGVDAMQAHADSDPAAGLLVCRELARGGGEEDAA